MKSSIRFKNKPLIRSPYTIAGPKEKDSVYSKYFDRVVEDDKFGADTFEKAECKMLTENIKHVISSAKLDTYDINAIILGDLLNQIISASFMARSFDISYLGIYSACSTMSEAMLIGAMLVDGGYATNVLAATASHFSSAERQYRYPLELGCTRPLQSQWTVTGAGGHIINSETGFAAITRATMGKISDYGITDANNMGAAMAPAAADTLITHFKEFEIDVDEYDLIVTGDLGVLGRSIMDDLMWEKGYDIENKHFDCGQEIYKGFHELNQGGSGAGCSALLLNSYIFDCLKRKKYRKIAFLATGALLSPVSTQQGESIPCISHLVALESV